ncbi:condensation domain-containing protein, partial [Embleya sp. NPDC005575]|uniref:condensation domain-containing protein n=1 Tax=Embleya sp. NPDC005575 TaxID=3156892 RepID=UPI0033BCD7D2
MGEKSLEARLLSRMRQRANSGRISRRETSGPLRLSFAQQRLWFLDRLAPGGAEYLIPFGLHVEGPLQLPALETALTGLVARHEILRTRFVADEGGEPTQVVDAPWRVTVTEHDLRDTTDAGTRESRAQELLKARAGRPFDLATGRLLRADVVRVADAEQYLLITMHHIVSDGWSEGIIGRELRDGYAAALGAGTAAVKVPEPPALQYADFSQWQRQWLTGDVLDRQLGYWRAALAGLEPLELPTDHRRPVVRSDGGDAVTFTIGAELADRVKAIGAGEGASLFMTLLAVFQVLLSKYS